MIDFVVPHQLLTFLDLWPVCWCLSVPPEAELAPVSELPQQNPRPVSARVDCPSPPALPRNVSGGDQDRRITSGGRSVNGLKYVPPVINTTVMT